MKKINYRNYTIEIKYSDEDAVYYPYITDEDNEEIYDGLDADFCMTEDEAINTAKEFIEDMLNF